MKEPDEKQKALLERLFAAFASAPASMRKVADHPCFECDRLNKDLGGKPWREFFYKPFELLGTFAEAQTKPFVGRDCFPLLSPDAFGCYLPLFLAGMVLEPGEADVMFDSIGGQFDPGPPREDAKLWEWNREKCETLIALLTPEQREAVASVLEYLDRGFEPCPPTMKDAVDNLRSGKVDAWKKHTKPA